MENTTFLPVAGVIQRITFDASNCCRLTVSILTPEGITNVVTTEDTYVIKEVRLRPGMFVTAFYDASAPAPAIFPPQYNAVVIGQRRPNEQMAIGYFDFNFTAADNSLQLNIGMSTEIVSSNGQPYDCPPSDKLLIVYYTSTTFSIPPQTTPRRIIVMC